MGFWIAVLITLAVLGSVLWIRPSPRDRLLTEYRKLALSKGLKVRLLDEKLSQQLFPWIDNYRQFVFYEKALPRMAKPKSHKAIVARLTDDVNAHELDEVDLIAKAFKACESFDLLPKTAEAVVISAAGISFLWRESSQLVGEKICPVEAIDKFLTECIMHSEKWA